MTPKNNTTIVLALILLTGVVLRLPGIGNNFAGDEIDTVGPARSFVIAGDFRAFDTRNGPLYIFTHPPVRTLLYGYWAVLFGYSNIALRVVSLSLEMLFVVVIFFIGKNVYSDRVGLIAAGFAAISRYSIWFSNTVSVDTGHFLFTTSAAVLFFILYLKRTNRKHLIISFIFLLISLLTKFSALIIFIPILIGSYFYKKKKTGIISVAAAVILTILSMFIISSAFNSTQMFQEPLNVLLQYSSSNAPLNDYLFNKAFKLATISWQMTPFFAVLLLVSIFSLFSKRNKDFYILASWLVLGFLIIFMPYGQDSQRYFGVAMAPTFILAAKFLEKFDFKNKMMAVVALVTIVFSLLIGLNDLMGYYSPAYLGIFYLAALAALIYRKHAKNILVGGFIGLSIFFALTNANNLYLTSNTVENLSSKVIENGYNYKEVWSSKDIAYYIVPANETAYVNLIQDINFFTTENLRNNNVSYIAFYSTPDESRIIEATKFCIDPYIYKSHGYIIGFVCRVDKGKL